MFQYAFGRRLALQNKTSLMLDTSHYSKYSDRNYELGCFRLGNDVTVGSAPKTFYDFGSAKNRFDRLKQLKLKLEGAPKLIAQRGFSFDLIGLVGAENDTVGQLDRLALKAGGNSYVSGFWQNEKYFLDYAENIRQDFSFNKKASGENAKIMDKIQAAEAPVSIHVRRGDYVTSPDASSTIGMLGEKYYAKAIKKAMEDIDNPSFYVFSDDPAWCKANLNLGGQAVFVEHNPPSKGWEDLRLMIACKHHVVANSSFSWWGAWLNPSSSKVVYAPKVWFRDTTIDTSDVVPRNWIRL